MKLTLLWTVVILSLFFFGCSSDETAALPEAPSGAQVTGETVGETTGETSTAAEGILLRYRFQAGDRFLVEMKNEMIASAAGIEIPVTIAAFSVWTIDAVDANGVATITQQPRNITFLGRYPNGTAVYDSADGEEPEHPGWVMIKPQLEVAQLASYTFKVDPRGTVSDFQYSAESLAQGKRMVEENPAMEPMIAAQRSATEQDNSAFFFSELPEQAISVGGEWVLEKKDREVFGGMGSFHSTYTLGEKELQNGKEVVGMDVEIEIDLDFPEDAEYRIEVDEALCTGLFSLSDGYFLKWVQKMDRTTYFQLNGMEQEEPVKMTVTVTMAPLPAADAN